MDISIKAKKNIFYLWLLVVPVGIMLVYLYLPSEPIDWGIYLSFVVLGLLAALFPFFIGGSTLFLTQWVTLAIFMKYGVLAELIAMQIAILPLVFHMKITNDTKYKMYYSSFMFFTISVISGLVVMLLGFEIGTLDIKSVVLYGTIYGMLNVVLNHVILYTREVVTGLKPIFFTKDFLWDIICLFITLPFAISLYMLESQLGYISLLLLGIPFFIITLLIRMYNDSERVNEDLTSASEFGHELADQRSSAEIFDLFMERITKMFPLDSAYIIDIVNDKFLILRAFEDEENKEVSCSHEEIKYSLIGRAYEKGSPILYNKQAEWMFMRPPFLALDMQSAMAVPIYRNSKIEGILVLASRHKYAFESYQLNIVHLLCSYFAVSLEKARFVRETVAKSEICELTKLYNYRYLDKQLEKEMDKLSLGVFKTLSLIMLDIDKFKSVNDTYGHHSGNLLLQEFARILKEEIGKEGTVGRYGGEEFVVILPNYTKFQAMNLAERLRHKIEHTPFIVEKDLSEIATEEIIFITASIGVSSAPDDSDEGGSLIRNADRALYIGAKQAGRNRVAEYVK